MCTESGEELEEIVHVAYLPSAIVGRSGSLKNAQNYIICLTFLKSVWHRYTYSCGVTTMVMYSVLTVQSLL